MSAIDGCDASRGYAEFIADVMDDPALLTAFEEALPFGDPAALVEWLGARGYHVAPSDAEEIHRHQSALGGSEAVLPY